MTARRWSGPLTAAVAAIVAIVVVWPGGAGSVPVHRPATHPPSSHLPAPCTRSGRDSCGTLVIGSRYAGGLPTEGALVSLTLTRGHTSVVPRRMMGGVGRRSVRLPAGRFTLHSVLNICDANCGHLDPPVRCTPAPLRIRVHRTTRATVVLGVARCRVTVTR